MLNWERWTIMFIVLTSGEEYSIEDWNHHVAFTENIFPTMKPAEA